MLETNADFYLNIANDELKYLERLSGPVTVGTAGYSRHFRCAVIATAFSAFAVEYAITELIWIECFLKTPAPHRKKTRLLASKLRSVPEKLEFLRTNAGFHGNLLTDISKLFDRRNRLVHLRNKEIVPHEGGVLDVEDVRSLNEQGRGAELDTAIESALNGEPGNLKRLADEFGKPSTNLTFEGLSTEVIEEAKENYGIAETALKAIRKLWGSK